MAMVHSALTPLDGGIVIAFASASQILFFDAWKMMFPVEERGGRGQRAGLSIGLLVFRRLSSMAGREMQLGTGRYVLG